MAIYKLVDSEWLDSIFTDIANAIRRKNGSTTTYTETGLETAIDEIEVGNSDDILRGIIERSITSFEFPSGITTIANFTFYNYADLALTELPASITYIGQAAFDSCHSLTLTELPASITYIGRRAFSSCSKLTTLTFKGTPSRIEVYAFYDCTNLTDIFVPWSEGEVANAPWGATNAIIHYNSQV